MIENGFYGVSPGAIPPVGDRPWRVNGLGTTLQELFELGVQFGKRGGREIPLSARTGLEENKLISDIMLQNAMESAGSNASMRMPALDSNEEVIFSSEMEYTMLTVLFIFAGYVGGRYSFERML